jgi:hypothetical protein
LGLESQCGRLPVDVASGEEPTIYLGEDGCFPRIDFIFGHESSAIVLPILPKFVENYRFRLFVDNYRFRLFVDNYRFRLFVDNYRFRLFVDNYRFRLFVDNYRFRLFVDNYRFRSFIIYKLNVRGGLLTNTLPTSICRRHGWLKTGPFHK